MSTEPSDETLALAERLFDLAREGATTELVAYLDAGAPVDLTNAKGDTLLILAAYRQQAETVRALLERGADVERLNDRNQNALTCAVFKQDAEIARLLLDAGADPDAGSPSARATAEFFNLPEMAALLTQRRHRVRARRHIAASRTLWRTSSPNDAIRTFVPG